MESESGISFTEFTYQLLQGYDYVHLARSHGVRLQVRVWQRGVNQGTCMWKGGGGGEVNKVLCCTPSAHNIIQTPPL